MLNTPETLGPKLTQINKRNKLCDIEVLTWSVQVVHLGSCSSLVAWPESCLCLLSHLSGGNAAGALALK